MPKSPLRKLRNLRNLSIPTKVLPEYRSSVDFIINHLGIESYSEIVRICIFDKRDWIKGDKVLVDSNNPHNKIELQLRHKEFISETWKKFDDNVKRYSKEKMSNEMRSLFKATLKELSKIGMENERLKLKYEF